MQNISICPERGSARIQLTAAERANSQVKACVLFTNISIFHCDPLLSGPVRNSAVQGEQRTRASTRTRSVPPVASLAPVGTRGCSEGHARHGDGLSLPCQGEHRPKRRIEKPVWLRQHTVVPCGPLRRAQEISADYLRWSLPAASSTFWLSKLREEIREINSFFSEKINNSN